jgi:DNA ligase-1
MKCYPFEEKRLLSWQPPFIVQPKYDGFRCRALTLPNERVILLSSEENVFFSTPHINGYLETLNLPFELDGELYCHGMSFEQISSIISRSKNIHCDHQKIQFHAFDIINEEPQGERLRTLINLSLRPPIYIAPYYICSDLQAVMDTYNMLLSYGYEGIIVRYLYNIYERKRSTSVMKFKPKQEDNYVIVGVQEEISASGSPKGTLGSLICASGDGGTFSVGSGFTASQRKSLWESRDKLVGRTCKVLYQHITTGKKVPRFPVFVEVI